MDRRLTSIEFGLGRRFTEAENAELIQHFATRYMWGVYALIVVILLMLVFAMPSGSACVEG